MIALESVASWMTTTLREVKDGTRITIVRENVPLGIGAEEHAAGLPSMLRKLAAFID